MMLEVRYISLALCPSIDEATLTESLYEVYRTKYGHELTEIHQMLSTYLIESEAATFFDLHGPVSGLLVDGVTFCGREIILEMEKSIYRGDQYSFAVRAIMHPSADAPVTPSHNGTTGSESARSWVTLADSEKPVAQSHMRKRAGR